MYENVESKKKAVAKVRKESALGLALLDLTHISGHGHVCNLHIILTVLKMHRNLIHPNIKWVSFSYPHPDRGINSQISITNLLNPNEKSNYF